MSTRDVRATQTLNACRVIIFWISVSVPNGPLPCTAAQIATPEAIKAAGAAPRRRNRQAASMIKGKTRYSRRRRFWNSTKVSRPTPTSSPVSSAAVRSVSAGVRAWGSRLRSKGATRSTPIASPVHQTAQVGKKLPVGTVADSARTDVPTVALIVIATSAPSTMRAAASRKRSSSIRNPIRLRRAAAVSGARVLPAAMTAAPRGEGPMGRLTASAPRNMDGQTRRPNTRIATRAIPVGGQMGVTWPCTRARRKLTMAASQ